MHEPSEVGQHVGHWLLLLRDGTEQEQRLARTELGLILEARGMLDDAAEAYARNVADGVTDRRPYERLAALARLRGDVETEAATLRALADLLAPPPPEPEPEAEPEREPEAEASPDLSLAAAAGADLTEPGDLMLAAAPGDLTPPAPLRGANIGCADIISYGERGEASDAPPEPDEHEEKDAEAPPASVAAPVAAGDVAADLRDETQPGMAAPRPAPDSPASASAGANASVSHPPPPAAAASQPSGVSRWALTLCGLVVAAVVVGAALMVPVSRPLTVAPSQPAASPASVEMQAPATAPALRLSPSPAASPSVATPLAAARTPTAAPAAIGASSPTPAAPPLAARCADVGLRFPESEDTERAVRMAFREYLARQGVTIDAVSTEFARLSEAYAERHAEVVAGWMAVTLQRERRGLPTFPLVDFVASDVVAASGPGAYQLRATVSPQGWSELRSAPAETCEGAFFGNPANGRWVSLMQASVGDITWALPTPQPRP